MNDLLWIIGFGLSAFLIVYHHVGYPLLLKWLPLKQQDETKAPFVKRAYKASKTDSQLPSITVIVPAYNEEQWIAEKIRNLASLDYPRDKLRVVIACDGCTDNTAEIAQATIQEAICSDTLFIINDHQINRGKVALLNEEMRHVSSDITALSDTSALISCDSLLLASQHYQNENVGVVNATYQIMSTDNQGEAAYWRYQSRVKHQESLLGSTIGSHGAFYTFRTHLFEPLEVSTINDDFILPMRIVLRGYSAIYEPNMLALELEQSSDNADFKRRLRISAGNMQQIMQLKQLLLPRYRGTAFAFLSGKVLRLATPYLMIVCFICSLLLAHNPLFQVMLFAQVGIYSIALITYLMPALNTIKPFKLISYIVIGHLANFIGGMKYLLGMENGRWKRVNQ
ncbi:glycosyltransferase family 2 protein [Vibrio sp. B513a]|mgnify:FL=1|uniref:glycosyltransferase family 2 protein n=1 Tax=Vibrio TaxID=662 RepID=UPI0004719383|nr:MULTISPECIES: glycosyltransferase family 2 protein [Vibrio]EJG1639249.1 glycosyltransferase family 2 protein [Vibrio alginolyticus]EKA3117673.1 glycosyltransferase family 2 protein [Vibrio alginolyticus]MBS9831272.1 glycosyltransferase family 2 protein [Vibrio alginolyticus]MBS9910231.1 glycosyltransferase family 2 protein [Vibrio alginolyticus]MBT0014738.1 glycosyltransferase family 2 protein [Vibrio alginolyticus]